MDKKYRCLFFEEGGCQWEGLVIETFDHFISAHKASYKPHPINVEIDLGTVYQFLNVVFNRVFFVQVKASIPEILECLVKCVHVYDHVQPPLCEYCIQSDYDNFESSHKGMVYSLNNRMNMYLFDFHTNCIHPTTRIRCTITNINNYSNMDLIPTYVHNYSLEKVFENDDTPKPVAAGEPSTTKISQCETTSFLEEIECPVCLDYMNAPIFNCTAGHSFCYDCKTKLDVCPTCRAKLTGSRNFILEKLILKLQHPCKYAEYGCVQILNWEKVKQHIDTCFYKPIKCPFPSCDQQYVCLLTIGEHFKKVHSALLFEENQLLEASVYYTSSTTHSCTILNSVEVFLLIFMFKNRTNSVTFECVHVTDKENKRDKYAFELQFVSKVDGNLKFAVNHYCRKAGTTVDPLILPLQVLQSFISKEKTEYKLYFKCLIQKV